MHGSLDLILCARYARSSPMSLASHSARCVPLSCRQTQHTTRPGSSVVCSHWCTALMPPLVTRLGDQHAPNPGRTRVNYSGVQPAYVALSMDPGGFILVVRPSAKSYPVYLGIEHLVGGGGDAAAAAAAAAFCHVQDGRWHVHYACSLPFWLPPSFCTSSSCLIPLCRTFLLYPDATISAWLGTRHHAVRVTWGEGARKGASLPARPAPSNCHTHTLYGTSGLR